MNQKQYDAMESIMTFGRIFADQIAKCMENSGLLEDGFKFFVSVTDAVEQENKFYESVALRQSVGNPKWYETAKEQFRFANGGWKEYNDYPTETGFAHRISEVKTDESNRTVRERVAENSSKPYPPDNMWLSAFDDYSDVDGGE